MTTAKPTKGPYTAHSVLTVIQNECSESNANLIAEAFNIYLETSLTPRQLDDQRRELLNVCEKTFEQLEMIVQVAPIPSRILGMLQNVLTKVKGETKI